MARFKEKVNIQSQSLDTGIIQGSFSVVQKLENFQSQQRQVTSGLIQQLGERAEKSGTESGQEVPIERVDGKTQKPKFKEEKFIGSIKIKAHNKALRAAYLASLGNDIREGVSRIRAENPDNVLEFNDAVRGYSKGVIDGADSSVRHLVITALDDKITSNRMAVQIANVKKDNDFAKETLDNAINSATDDAFQKSRNGEDIESTKSRVEAYLSIDETVEAGFISAGEGIEKKRNIARVSAEQREKGNLDRLADINIPKAFEHLDNLSKKIPDGWTVDEWSSFITSSQQDLNRKAARMKRQVVKLTKEQLLQESIGRGKSFMNPDIPADPAKSSQDRKDVNNAYEVVSQEWAELPPMDQFNSHVAFVKNTGIMPDKLIKGVNASMRSGNADQVNIFASVITEIAKESNAANILKDIPVESRAIAQQVSDSIEAGIDIEVAVEIARKNTFGLTEPEREQIRISTQALRSDMVDILDDMIEDDDEFDVFIFEPDASPALQADFNVSFDKFMILTNGDPDQSSTLAFESIKKVWAMTTIGGPKRFMKYAPETVYSIPGISNKWMDKQYDKDMKQAGLDLKGLFMAVDFETANSNQPSWPIMTTDENGIISPLHDDDGNILRWTPDFTKTREYFKLKDKPTKAVESAIDIRSRVDKLNEIIGTKKIISKPSVL